jgi:hypothetical protein
LNNIISDKNFIVNDGFLNSSVVPTDLYSDYKIDDQSKITIAKGVRTAYRELERRNNKFQELTDEQLKVYVKPITKLGDQSTVLSLIVKTLGNLIQLGDFTHNGSPVPINQQIDIVKQEEKRRNQFYMTHNGN